MAAISYWDDSEGIWDRLSLGGVALPGVWKVTFRVRRQIDTRKRRGKDGGRIKDEGYRPAEIRMVGRLLGTEAWEQYQAFVPSIHPRRHGALRTPQTIVHPTTQLLSIRSVYVIEIAAPEIVDNGIQQNEIVALEYQPNSKNANQGKKVKGERVVFEEPELPDVQSKVPT